MTADDLASSLPTGPWPAADYLPHLERLAGAMTEALSSADLDAAVPACPGWTVRDLAGHVAHVHRWATGAIVEGHPDTPTRPAPVGAAQAAQEYRDAADALLAVLRSTPSDGPAWGFGPKPRTVAFWARRQPHEVAVHLVDVLAARGDTAVPDPELALDGVDEVVTLFLPRQVRLGRTPPLERSVALVSGGRRWVLAGDGSSTVDPGDADATVSGPPERLLLLLWGRLPLDDPALTLTGDRDAARAVLGARIVP